MDMILTTKRLLLRPLIEDDFAAVHRYASALENVIFMPFGPNSEDDTRAFIMRAIAGWQQIPQNQFDFAVTLRESGQLIGAGGLYLKGDLSEASAGWILHRDYWKQGYCSEFAAALLRFGFESLNLHRIYATCDANNQASYRVMERNGMRREAHYIKSVLARDAAGQRSMDKESQIWHDGYLYALLAEEWVPAP
jgi:[ribosomal protein S5]-alanine N-acetyltransferase